MPYFCSQYARCCLLKVVPNLLAVSNIVPFWQSCNRIIPLQRTQLYLVLVQRLSIAKQTCGYQLLYSVSSSTMLRRMLVFQHRTEGAPQLSPRVRGPRIIL